MAASAHSLVLFVPAVPAGRLADVGIRSIWIAISRKQAFLDA
jgi:hypothetical protein